MDQWSARKGAAGIASYQAEKNRASIDGLAALRDQARAGEPDPSGYPIG
ncbi:MAG: hypothetical protein ACRDX8_13255 [Acidimicrobiales bacterium]